MTDALDALRALDPSPASSRSRVAGSDWGDAMAAAIIATPPRRGRARRWAGAAVAAGAVAAIAALMVVLIVASGGGDPAPAATEVVLVATPAPGGPAVDSATLERTAALIRERATLLGTDVTVTPRGGALVLGIPDDAPEGLVAALTARGELAIHPYGRALAGPPTASFDAAVRQAQEAAGAPVRGGRRDAVPPGFSVVREDIVPAGRTSPAATAFSVLRGTPALTGEDLVAVREDPTAAAPTLVLSLSPEGQRAFGDLTRTLAQDGALRLGARTMAVVLDGSLVAAPEVDYERYPIGLDGRDGLIMELRPDLDARTVAAQLTTGPLPVRLAPGWG